MRNYDEMIFKVENLNCLSESDYYKKRQNIKILEFLRDIENGTIKVSDSLKKTINDKIANHIFDDGSFVSEYEHEIYCAYIKLSDEVKIENGKLNILGDSSKKITVKELIEALSKVKDKSKNVVIQYRDDGGEYSGYDESLYLREEDNHVIL